MSEEEALYSDDETHPIPFVYNLDLVGGKKTGGATLVITIASPINEDERSQKRLLRKLENYISFTQSGEFHDEFGQPSSDNTDIQVVVHQDSSDIIFELLDNCKKWVEENNISFSVKRAS